MTPKASRRSAADPALALGALVVPARGRDVPLLRPPHPDLDRAAGARMDRRIPGASAERPSAPAGALAAGRPGGPGGDARLVARARGDRPSECLLRADRRADRARSGRFEPAAQSGRADPRSRGGYRRRRRPDLGDRDRDVAARADRLPRDGDCGADRGRAAVRVAGRIVRGTRRHSRGRPQRLAVRGCTGRWRDRARRSRRRPAEPTAGCRRRRARPSSPSSRPRSTTTPLRSRLATSLPSARRSRELARPRASSPAGGTLSPSAGRPPGSRPSSGTTAADSTSMRSRSRTSTSRFATRACSPGRQPGRSSSIRTNPLRFRRRSGSWRRRSVSSSRPWRSGTAPLRSTLRSRRRRSRRGR